jgi:hypothetical protein
MLVTSPRVETPKSTPQSFGAWNQEELPTPLVQSIKEPPWMLGEKATGNYLSGTFALLPLPWAIPF